MCHRIRIALLLAGISAVAVSPARADVGPKATGPTMRTIEVTECVEEKYEVKRKCFRTECREEVYDSFRCENVCEQREQVCTVVKRIPVHHTETRKVCCNEYTCEDRVVMKKCYEYRQVTCMVKKCVCKGHWECREVCKEPGFFEKLCNPCACPHTVCKKCWVHCPVYQECPVTRCQKVCVEKPVCCKVRVCHPVWKEVQVQTCTYRCVEEKHVVKYNVMVTRKVPCKATRIVRVCVPYEETVICCRMVPRVVQRQVAVVECCPTPCCPVRCCQPRCCTSCCPHDCCHRGCSGLRFRQHGCCDDCCH